MNLRDGNRLKLLWAFAACSAFSACTSAQLQDDNHRGAHARSGEAFPPASEGPRAKHGVRMSWYPEGGKRSMEIYSHGYRQGYSVAWHPDGKLKSLAHYTDGVRDGEARHWDESGGLLSCLTREGADCRAEVSSGGRSASMWADIGRGP